MNERGHIYLLVTMAPPEQMRDSKCLPGLPHSMRRGELSVTQTSLEASFVGRYTSTQAETRALIVQQEVRVERQVRAHAIEVSPMREALVVLAELTRA
jgi:hypothetical protein